MSEKTLFHNATFYSLNSRNESFKAVLVENGTIIEVYNHIPDLTCKKVNLKNNKRIPSKNGKHYVNSSIKTNM